MPEITISDEMFARVTEFRQVIEGVIEEEIGTDGCIELVLVLGMDSMLVDLLGPLDPAILLKSFQQLAAKHPAEVYRYIAETMKEGAILQQQREKMKRRLGFPTKANQDNNKD